MLMMLSNTALLHETAGTKCPSKCCGSFVSHCKTAELQTQKVSKEDPLQLLLRNTLRGALVTFNNVNSKRTSDLV